MRTAKPPPPPPLATEGEQARSLNDAALVSYGRSSDVAAAIALQTQAFGANPFDSEVAGNLAFLHLRERPPQVEVARRLGLHALTLNDPRFPSGRTEDWTTLAIASALTGHDADARNAWYVALALTGDLQRLCSAAVSAEASHGELLRPSVQALLQRARSSAAYGRCEVGATSPSRGKAQAKPAQRPRRTIP
jgi:predicted Zn-dependent protease